ncbi:complement C1q-like protein 4 isoform X1 [Oryzias latipes]|uniref:complement C1q-like protein 4 isoform X1 n=1 Tax=Oryzias latipes TaxID=8090 RepID=UPI000CE1850E|nr:complement C1q-like protein 4 isoform X1 [Oryzias latipes]
MSGGNTLRKSQRKKKEVNELTEPENIEHEMEEAASEANSDNENQRSHSDTKLMLDGLAKISAQIHDLDTELRGTKNELKQEISSLRQDMDRQFKEHHNTLKNQKADLAEAQTRIATLEESNMEANGTPRVAFSAALRDSGSGNIGPFTTSTPLKYKRIFSNYGDCYNPSTGVFTATVNGVYFFRFSMFNNLSPTPNSVVILKKNDQLLTAVWDVSGTDSNDMGSNAVVIPLKVGDNVYVELQENRLVYDDGANYNTFSGFLLFPV